MELEMEQKPELIDEEINDEKATAMFNQIMLKTLMVELFRDVNLQFNVVNNTKFRAFCRFICPNIKIPTPQELVNLNVNNSMLFKTWDRETDSATLDEERQKMVEQWTKSDLRRVTAPEKEKSNTEILTLIGTDAQSVKDMQLWGFKTVFEPITSLPIPPKPVAVVVVEESKPELVENVKLEVLEEQIDEIEYKPTPEELAGPSFPPDLFPSHPIPEYTEKQGKGISAKLITFPDVPGYIKWPCLVCSQRREVSKLRSVNNTDAYIMLYVCLKGGQYDMTKAKELARMEKFKCCVDHLHDLYEQALVSLSITDPRFDIHTENRKVVEAYHLVKEIKGPRCTQKLVFEGSRKHILPFVNQLKNFFLKYGRSNYAAEPGQPGYLMRAN